MKQKLLLIGLLLTSILNAKEASFLDELTRTNISFNMDEDGNLNPNIYIPVYYGSSKQFYSAVGFSSTNAQEVKVLDAFSDSKNAFISNSKDLLLNYVTYQTFLFGYQTSIGINSKFSNIKNNEFGYIHDSDSVFGNGSDYYTSFDNDIELDVQRHAINADIVIPMGEYFSSRFYTSISPYTSIGVKQETIFKPLVSETGISSSTTTQSLAYTFRYDGLIKTGTFFNIGLVAYYDNQPLKYDVAQLAQKESTFVFETATVDTKEVTTRFLAKILFDIEVLGGLRPSLGYGIENVDVQDNLSGESTSTDKKLITFGFEKLF